MNKCKICGKETENNIYCSMECRDVGRKSDATVIIKCKMCGKEIHCYKKRKKTYCSNRCATSDPELNAARIDSMKNTCKEKYGTNSYFESKDFLEKSKNTAMKRYGVSSYSKTPEYKNKFKKTMMEKYGVEYAQQSSAIKEKTYKTVHEKYGGFTLETEKGKQLVKKSLIKRYSTDNPLKSDEIKEKIKINNQRKYGTDWPLSSKKIQNKIKKTIKEKYGVSNVSQINDIKSKIKNIRHADMYNSMVNDSRLNNLSIPLFNKNDYFGVGYYTKYKFKCSLCDKEFEDFLRNGHIPRCPECFPKNLPYSNEESEIFEYIHSIVGEDVVRNSKKILPSGKELDIYIPSKSIAIEYDGLYWHSEISGNKNKNYHLEKTTECEGVGIKLIHIFSDEWEKSKDIVKERIKHILQKDNETIYARKCTVIEIDSKYKNDFLNKYHLQGTDKSNIKIGAYHLNELVAVMTFSKPRLALGRKNSLENEYELTRFALSKNVVGIASKLMSYFIKKYKPSFIISYADKRWSSGNLYDKLGFSLQGNTSPNYWYTSDYINRLHRFNFRKDKLKEKLESFDDSLSEWQNMKNNGYDRIWDCGSLKYIWQNKNGEF